MCSLAALGDVWRVAACRITADDSVDFLICFVHAHHDQLIFTKRSVLPASIVINIILSIVLG